MPPLSNTPFGRRLRGQAQEATSESDTNSIIDDPANPFRVSTPTFLSTPTLEASSSASASSSSGTVSPMSPGKKRKRVWEGVDRFVPNRDAGDLRVSFNLMEEGGPSTPSKGNRMIPSESDAIKEQANATFSTLLESEFSMDEPRPSSPTRRAQPTATPSTPSRGRRIFEFTSPARPAPGTPSRAGLDSVTSGLYASSPIRQESAAFLSTPQKQPRVVSKTPFRVLDAPDLTDDFYLNLVDWSSTNVLGVGLGTCVYLWTAHTATVTKLCDLGQSDTVTSLNWVQKGNTIAVGTLHGKIHIWDAEKCIQLRTLDGHTGRVGALAWNDTVLCSGSRDRTICHRDIRDPGVSYRKLLGHRQEVCGLTWNSGINHLASGGNDNKLLIWDARQTTPLHKFHEHTAAVKAIAWNPHVPGILASGGGTADKKIRFWNTLNGTMLKELDTGSQVCNLTWSKTSQELVSTHGYSSTHGQNQICIWKYPSMDMVATLSGHTARVLYLAMSPDGQTIVTGAGDETLRFWNAFPKPPEAGKRKETRKLDPHQQIR